MKLNLKIIFVNEIQPSKTWCFNRSNRGLSYNSLTMNTNFFKKQYQMPFLFYYTKSEKIYSIAFIYLLF
jgi:hypothetical protein